MERVITGLFAAQLVVFVITYAFARRARSDRDAAQAARATACSAADRAERSAARALQTALKVARASEPVLPVPLRGRIVTSSMEVRIPADAGTGE